MFYCGIDLSASDSQLCVVDECLAIRLQQKAANETGRTCSPPRLPFIEQTHPAEAAKLMSYASMSATRGPGDARR